MLYDCSVHKKISGIMARIEACSSREFLGSIVSVNENS